MEPKAMFLAVSLCCLLNYGATQEDAFEQYIEQYRTLAVAEMERAGIPASIKLAQGLLESNAGRSELAREANNHFGVKCGGSWNGGNYMKEDDETNWLGFPIKSCFRQYNSVEESFIAHSEFLRNPAKDGRYGFLFQLEITDYEGWAKGLKQAGYATSKTYHKKLISLIERYELHQYDELSTEELLAMEAQKDEEPPTEGGWELVLEEPENPGGEEEPEIPIMQDPFGAKPEETPAQTAFRIDVQNDARFLVSNSQQTVATLADWAGVSTEELLKFNSQFDRGDQRVAPMSRVYLQPKRNHYRGKKKWHDLQEGQTLFDISQLYGISLEKLYERNRLQKGMEPMAGARIKIRGGEVSRPPRHRNQNHTPDKEPVAVISDDGELMLDMDLSTGQASEETPGEKKKEQTEAANPNAPFKDPFHQPDSQKTNPQKKLKEQQKTPTTSFQKEDLKNLQPEDGAASSAGASNLYYDLRPGAPLWSISRRFDTSVNRLTALNALWSQRIYQGCG